MVTCIIHSLQSSNSIFFEFFKFQFQNWKFEVEGARQQARQLASRQASHPASASRQGRRPASQLLAGKPASQQASQPAIQQASQPACQQPSQPARQPVSWAQSPGPSTFRFYVFPRFNFHFLQFFNSSRVSISSYLQFFIFQFWNTANFQFRRLVPVVRNGGPCSKGDIDKWVKSNNVNIEEFEYWSNANQDSMTVQWEVTQDPLQDLQVTFSIYFILSIYIVLSDVISQWFKIKELSSF